MHRDFFPSPAPKQNNHEEEAKDAPICCTSPPRLHLLDSPDLSLHVDRVRARTSLVCAALASKANLTFAVALPPSFKPVSDRVQAHGPRTSGWSILTDGQARPCSEAKTSGILLAWQGWAGDKVGIPRGTEEAQGPRQIASVSSGEETQRSTGCFARFPSRQLLLLELAAKHATAPGFGWKSQIAINSTPSWQVV